MDTDKGSKPHLLPITERSVIAIKRRLKIPPDFCVAGEKFLFVSKRKTEYLCAVFRIEYKNGD
jgi:hypothetical protein